MVLPPRLVSHYNPDRMHRPPRNARPWRDKVLLFLLGVGWVLGVAGCAPRATFLVDQPRLTGRQQHMKLTSDEAAYGHADAAEVWHILLRFPLPGATSGDAEYTVYLCVPDSTTQEIVAYTIGRTAAAHGFFYQAHGEQRGREDLVEGCVWLKRKSARQWLVTVKAKGRLATRIEGTALLTRHDLDVREYLEARHAGDIAQLMQNVPAPTPTE